MIQPRFRMGVPFLVVVVIAIAVRVGMAQAPTNKACGLVTDAELQSVLGSKVMLKAGSIGEIQTCGGETQSAKVLLRFFKRASDPSGKKEQAGIAVQ